MYYEIPVLQKSHYFLNKTHNTTVHKYLEEDFAFSAAENH